MAEKTTFKFRIHYLYLTIILFIIEVFIALFIRDSFIRPYMGDVLVVILIYCFLKIFWNARPLTVGISVLLFSYCVEILQYFKIVELLGLQDNRIASIVIGSSFDWLDLAAYTVGIGLTLLVEMRLKR